MKTNFKMSGGLAGVLLSAALAMNLAAQSPATFKVGELTFTRPAKWEWVPTTSAMRAAQLKLTDDAKKETGEVVFFNLPGGGGGVQPNIDRWLSQFEEPREKLNSKVENVMVGKTKITYVHAEGTYKSGMPGAGPTTPMAGYVLEGAIIELGPENNIFVRMTGPKALMKASVEEFRKMIQSGPAK